MVTMSVTDVYLLYVTSALMKPVYSSVGLCRFYFSRLFSSHFYQFFVQPTVLLTLSTKSRNSPERCAAVHIEHDKAHIKQLLFEVPVILHVVDVVLRVYTALTACY